MTHRNAATTAHPQHGLLAERIRAISPRHTRREIVILVALGLVALTISLSIAFLDPAAAFALSA
ncbi:hypothetical protein [Antribacter gilvus]|uniref:hypothetical protein n=1 Tax=Antribacter gilvus TaxID=2304675 RepID=UPI000F7B5848|nr:hypothetical protein [Antribacter gilvus]